MDKLKIWSLIIVLFSILRKAQSLSCYVCLHIEMGSSDEFVNSLLKFSQVTDEHCKKNGDEFLEYRVKSKQCKWREDNKFLEGSDLEDFYQNEDKDTQDYFSNYYSEFNNNPYHMACEKMHGEVEASFFGIEIQVSVWGRGCKVLPGDQGHPPDACSTDIATYEHGLFYMLHKQLGGFMESNGKVCLCTSSLCNSGVHFKPTSTVLVACLMLYFLKSRV